MNINWLIDELIGMYKRMHEYKILSLTTVI